MAVYMHQRPCVGRGVNPKRVRAATYLYLEGKGEQPTELLAKVLLRRFGPQAVYGRPLTVGEMGRIYTAEMVVEAWQSKAASKNSPFWAIDNPGLSSILKEAKKSAYGTRYKS